MEPAGSRVAACPRTSVSSTTSTATTTSIPWKGGPTATANLHCLCSKHHNVKTTGARDVTLHPDGTETWTSLGDGHTVMTAPNGPLGRETFRHRAVRRTTALAEYNRRKMQRNLNDQPPF